MDEPITVGMLVEWVRTVVLVLGGTVLYAGIGAFVAAFFDERFDSDCGIFVLLWPLALPIASLVLLGLTIYRKAACKHRSA